MRTNYTFGLHKAPFDSRDFLMESFFEEGKELPFLFDSLEPTSPLTNQGTEGTCAGQNAKNTRERQEWIDHGKFIKLSWRDVYERAKDISGHSVGTTLIAIAKALMEGICEEQFWMSIPNEPGQPEPGIEENRAKYKIGGYARITGVNAMKRAIYEGYPKGLLFGMKVYNGFISKQSKKTGIVPDPTRWDAIKGPRAGHAITPGANAIASRIGCGWNDESPFFKNDGHMYFKGSWGNFGFHGYHIISYTNIEKNGLDCICILDEKTIKKAKAMGPILTVADLNNTEGLWV